MDSEKKNIFVCDKCNARVFVHSEYCPKCGEVFIDSEKAEVVNEDNLKLRQCPKCLKKIEAEYKQCPDCGFKFLFDEADEIKKKNEKLKKYGYGQKLLLERELLFEQVFCEEKINDIIKYFSFFGLLFSSIYGFCLGIYSGYLQMIVGTVKIPALLLLSMFVCAPPLYTFNVLLGSKLSFKQILAMLFIKTYMISIILISFSPIAAFFIITGGHHDFITLLNLIIFAIAGSFGVIMLWNGMKYITVRNGYEPNQTILGVWIIIFTFVGLQLAWTLRPFVGGNNEFTLFRQIGGNVYLYIIDLLKNIFIL